MKCSILQSLIYQISNPLLCVRVYFSAFFLDLCTALIAFRVNPLQMYLLEQNRIFADALFNGNWLPWLLVLLLQFVAGAILSTSPRIFYEKYLEKKEKVQLVSSILLIENLLFLSLIHVFGAFTNVYFIFYWLAF